MSLLDTFEKITQSLRDHGATTRQLSALILFLAGLGAGWWIALQISSERQAAQKAQLESAQALAARDKEELARVRDDVTKLSTELKETKAALDRSEDMLRNSDSGDATAALRRRVEQAESQASAALLERDRLERALAAKERERQQWQAAKEEADKSLDSFRGVAMGTLSGCGLRGELKSLEAEKSALLKKANDLSVPSSEAPWESRVAQRDIVLKEVDFKRKLIEDITLRCKQ